MFRDRIHDAVGVRITSLPASAESVFTAIKAKRAQEPSGARNSSNFIRTIVVDNPRTAQIGLRLTF